jgi:hypothetical protein
MFELHTKCKPKERYKSVTDPLIIPHRSRLSSAELPVLGGPQRSLLIDGANPYHFRSIQTTVLWCELRIDTQSDTHYITTISQLLIAVTASEPIYALQFGVTITEFVS